MARSGMASPVGPPVSGHPSGVVCQHIPDTSLASDVRFCAAAVPPLREASNVHQRASSHTIRGKRRYAYLSKHEIIGGRQNLEVSRQGDLQP